MAYVVTPNPYGKGWLCITKSCIDNPEHYSSHSGLRKSATGVNTFMIHDNKPRPFRAIEIFSSPIEVIEHLAQHFNQKTMLPPKNNVYSVNGIKIHIRPKGDFILCPAVLST